jgi:hypothetical protein
MTQEEIKQIEENNKLIDKFYWEGFKGQRVSHNPSPINMGYHMSWDALMPVVEKISKDYDVSISSVGMWACFISRQDFFDGEITSRGGFEPMITNVYLSVVDFIKWYNQQPK